jgi:hypothetical protein
MTNAEKARIRANRIRADRLDYQCISDNENGAAAVVLHHVTNEGDPSNGEKPFVKCLLHWEGNLPESPDIWTVGWSHYLGYLEQEPEIVFDGCPDPELAKDAFKKCVAEFRVGTGLPAVTGDLN